MRTRPRREPVAKVDTAWLHMDEASNLMVVTLLLVFGRPLAYERMKELVETRLLKLPRFRQRIVDRRTSARGVSLGGPHWEDDPHFDIDRHFERATLDDGDEESALRRFVSDAMSRRFDPSRPLWHFDFIPRYRGGTAMIARVHHCVGDGFSLVRAFLSMADDPESAVVGSIGCAPQPDARPGALARAVTSATTTARLLLMRSDPPTGLKGPLSIEKLATWSTPVPLEHVKAVSRAKGASINDVLVTAVTGALHRYLASRTPIEAGLVLRGVVPVNLRRSTETNVLGNHFGLVFLAMPVGLADADERLVEIRRRMRVLKRAQDPHVTFQILRGLGVAPRALFDLVVTMFGRKATAVVTNVIGPPEAVTYAGVPLSEVMFWVPCAGKLGLGISILSYAGRVSVGFAVDARLIPDPETIVEGFDRELAQLLEREYATQDVSLAVEESRR